MAYVSHHSPFFDLPLELREYVYRRVLTEYRYGASLLRVCRQIYSEAEKFLYQKSLQFDSQDDLYNWLSRADSTHLVHVAEIVVAIRDVNLKTLLTPRAIAQQDNAAPRLQIWDLYTADLAKLQHALERTPKLCTITLQALQGPQSHFYQKYMTKLLKSIGKWCPSISDLRLLGNFHEQDLGFLHNMKSLRSFSFDGFSSSSPVDVAATLSGLEHLSKLSLVSQHALLTTETQPESIFSSRPQSITGNVMKNMRELKYFRMTEFVPTPSPALFFTTDILTSLHNHKKLRHISIVLSHMPDPDTLASLENFLHASMIEQLELDWPSFDPAILTTHQLLTNSLQDVWFRANTISNACKIFSLVAENKELGNVQLLRRLVLMRAKSYCMHAHQESRYEAKDTPTTEIADYNNKTPHRDINYESLVSAQRYLRLLGVHVAFCTDE